MNTNVNAAGRTIFFVGGPANGKIQHVSSELGFAVNVPIKSHDLTGLFSQVSYVNSGLITDTGAEVWVVGQPMETNTAQVCAGIGELANMSTVDVLNILHALRLRQAGTPLQQQGRYDVAKALDASHTEIMGIWTRDEA